MNKLLQQAGLLLSAAMLTGCSGMWNEANLGDRTGKDVADNQIVAWVPVNQAETPTVVRAMMLVALGKAKKSTEKQLCAGQWVFTGDVDENAAPQRALAPNALGAYSAWEYRIRWNPSLPDCANVADSEYYRTLSANLPSWVIVQSGAEETIYHQGLAVFTGDTDEPHQLALQSTLKPDV